MLAQEIAIDRKQAVTPQEMTHLLRMFNQFPVKVWEEFKALWKKKSAEIGDGNIAKIAAAITRHQQETAVTAVKEHQLTVDNISPSGKPYRD